MLCCDDYKVFMYRNEIQPYQYLQVMIKEGLFDIMSEIDI